MRTQTMRAHSLFLALILFLGLFVEGVYGQAITGVVEGKVSAKSGGAVPGATITAVNTKTGLSRSTVTDRLGDYRIVHLPVGNYKVTVKAASFRSQTASARLTIDKTAILDFWLEPGSGEEVAAAGEEPQVERARTSTASLIGQSQIQDLPLNGRRFLDFSLLVPGVSVGNSASGSVDLVVEPVTRLSFAAQNLHYNFVAVDGMDNISTASALQKTTPSQEAVREFLVTNNTFGPEVGRAIGGVVTIVTKSGTNDLHGSAYEYFGNDAMDASSSLAAPGLKKLRQNQFGFTVGGPIVQDHTFFFAGYEGQRRRENPTYNSVILANLTQINQFKVAFGLAPEQLNVTRNSDYDSFLLKLDHSFSGKERVFVDYLFNDGRFTNLSPLADGSDLPSGFKDNFLRDQSVIGGLTSVFSSRWVNEVRGQYAHRTFNFPVDTTQPRLEVLNTFATGANRGQPEFYEESREEFADHASWQAGRHSIGFGGDFSHVDTQESFPLFYPFEADFACLLALQCPFSMQAGAPETIFFQRFQAPTFTEPTFNPGVFQGQRIPAAVRTQAEGDTGHTYGGLYLQDHWRATDRLTLNYGLRYQFETFPSAALDNPASQWDPRAGFAYSLGTKFNLVLRGGGGMFHGIMPMPLLACQRPSCGGTGGPFPGTNGDALNAATRLFGFASAPNITSIAFADLLAGTYPDAAPLGFCPGGVVSGCGFFGDVVTARFDKNHKPPYAIQASLGLELQPFPDSTLEITVMRSKGVHLGSFYNVNQPDPSGQVLVHNSQGQSGLKNEYFAAPGIPGSRSAAPGFPVLYMFYLEAASRWNSEWNGLLVHFNKRTSHHFSLGVSYTWSKGIDDGPDSTFVLVPQDTGNLKAERALSSDSVAHRFVLTTILDGPTQTHPLVDNFHLGAIITLESPHYFTKLAGFDANGDIFNSNDRVGLEPRNTFRGDGYQSVDLRLFRTFKPTERISIDAMAEAFNLFNTVNVRLFNTVYGAADFCPFNPAAQGCSAASFLEGSPNPNYGTPRAVYNPRQIQLALRVSF